MGIWSLVFLWESFFIMKNKVETKSDGSMRCLPYQLFSPSLQGVTLFLPVRGSSREFLHGAVSIEASLRLCLLLGQVAFLITGSGVKKKQVKQMHYIRNVFFPLHHYYFIINNSSFRVHKAYSILSLHELLRTHVNCKRLVGVFLGFFLILWYALTKFDSKHAYP